MVFALYKSSLPLLGLILLSAAVVSVRGAIYSTWDDFAGADCAASGFESRTVDQANLCFSGTRAQCNADGSVTFSNCFLTDCASDSCLLSRYAAGCTNYIYRGTQRSRRITCGNGVAEAPSGFASTLGVTSFSFSPSNTQCNTASEPGLFTRADYYVPNICDGNSTYVCDAGAAKIQKYTGPTCATFNGTAEPQPTGCQNSDVFDPQETRCTKPTILDSMPVIPASTVTYAPMKDLPGPASTYAVRDVFLNETLDGQYLLSREAYKTGYCESSGQYYYKYECLNTGYRMHQCTDSACSAGCAFRDYAQSDTVATTYYSKTTQYYHKSVCSYAPTLYKDTPTSYLYLQYPESNTMCNTSAQTGKDFTTAYWEMSHCSVRNQQYKQYVCQGTMLFDSIFDNTDSKCKQSPVDYVEIQPECVPVVPASSPKANSVELCGTTDFSTYATGSAARIISSWAFALLAILSVRVS